MYVFVFVFTILNICLSDFYLSFAFCCWLCQSKYSLSNARTTNEELKFVLHACISCLVGAEGPKKMFYGKDCCSLAVTIGAGMNNLHPILLHSTRGEDKLGLLSLDKYVLSRVMGFLSEVGQAVLPLSRAPFKILSSFTCGSLVFSVVGLCSGVVMCSLLFSRFC